MLAAQSLAFAHLHGDADETRSGAECSVCTLAKAQLTPLVDTAPVLPRPAHQTSTPHMPRAEALEDCSTPTCQARAPPTA
jgi:hypothetical protein